MHSCDTYNTKYKHITPSEHSLFHMQCALIDIRVLIFLLSVSARSRTPLSSRRTLLKSDTNTRIIQTQKVLNLSVYCSAFLSASRCMQLVYAFFMCIVSVVVFSHYTVQTPSTEPVFPSLTGCDSPVEDILPSLSPSRRL